MGPKLQFYLEALQLFCTKCLGASVYPAMLTIDNATEYAKLEILHGDIKYVATFYTDDDVPRIALRRITGSAYSTRTITDIKQLSDVLEKLFDGPGTVDVGSGFKFISQLLSFIDKEQDPFYVDLLDIRMSTADKFFKGAPYAILNPFAWSNLEGLALIFGFKFYSNTYSGRTFDLPFYLGVRIGGNYPGIVNSLFYGFDAKSAPKELDISDTVYPNALHRFTLVYESSFLNVQRDIRSFQIAR